ncbi:MAG: cytidine deaminase [Gammaproteobacteria bacterium]
MEDLLASAKAAQQKAYAPYSGFRVGASVRTRDGRIYAGCNVENAAYPEGICAEGSAIAMMVSNGDQDIAEVLVIGSGSAPCSPCGGCRQKLSEFADPNTVVHMCSDDGAHQTTTIAELMPHAFGPHNLET